MRALISFTLQRKLCTNMRRMQLLFYSPQPGFLARPDLAYPVDRQLCHNYVYPDLVLKLLTRWRGHSEIFTVTNGSD